MGEMENCRRETEFFRREHKEFLTNHKTSHSGGNVQRVWTKTLSVTLKTTKKVPLQKFFFFFSMLFSARVFPEASAAQHVGGSRMEKLQGGLSFLELQFISSDSPLYPCMSLRGQNRSVGGVV